MALKAIEEAFAERALPQTHKRGLISDDDVAQILSQAHTGFGVWIRPPFTTKRLSSLSHVTSSALPLHLRSSQYETTSQTIPPRTARLKSLTRWSLLLNSRVIYQSPTRASQDTTAGTRVGAEVIASGSFLPQLKNQRATIGESSVKVVEPRAESATMGLTA